MIKTNIYKNQKLKVTIYLQILIEVFDVAFEHIYILCIIYNNIDLMHFAIELQYFSHNKYTLKVLLGKVKTCSIPFFFIGYRETLRD